MSRTDQVRAHRPDYVLALAIFILLAFGLIMMYHINPALSYKLFGRVDSGYYFRSQLLNIGIGMVVWFAAASIYYKTWSKYAPYILGAAILASLALLIPDLRVEKNGATRWLEIGPVSFQPAELLKLGLVLYLAVWFEKRRTELKTLWEGVVPFAIVIGLISLVVAGLQRDLGTMLVIAMAAVGMYFVAGIQMRHLAALVLAGLAAGWIMIISFPHRLERLATFLDPAKNADGGAYHINQALIAIGSGGILGLGLGRSIQVNGYLPEASNDSIFAVIGEEFGLIGGLLLIGLFGLLIYRGVKIAAAAPDVFSRLVASGITLVFAFQAFINIAAMLAIVPLTGIPLPFISYGGSSMVVMLLMAGILFNISKYTVKEVAYAHSSERRGNGRSYIAGSGHNRRVKAARS